MDITEMNTPTLEECLALWKKKDWLRAEVAELELERRELQSAVDDLSGRKHTLCKATTQLCYDLSILFNQVGRLVDAEKTHLWTKWQEDIDNS